MNETRRSLLVHQLALAYDRRSWHGPNLRGSLRGLSLEAAGYRPQPERHNIWEIVVHCAYWKYRVCRLLSAQVPRSFPLKGSDWFARPARNSPAAWAEDLRLLEAWHAQLRATVEELDAARLDEPVRGGPFTVVELISGAAAHDLYHAGQIRLLRRLYAGTQDEADSAADAASA